MWKDHTRSSKSRLGKWVSIDRDEVRCVTVWEYSWFLHETVNNCPVLVPYHGEGNGNPLQCSCLENPRDGGA